MGEFTKLVFVCCARPCDNPCVPEERPPNPPTPTISYYDNVPAAKIARSGMARAALWIAILCGSVVFAIRTGPPQQKWLPLFIFTVVCTAVPIVLGIAGARDVHQRGVRGGWSATIAILIGLCGVPVIIDVAGRPAKYDRAYTIYCMSHLRSIGTALNAYVGAFGAWPESLEDLTRVPGSVIPSDYLACPQGRRSTQTSVSAAYLYVRPPEQSPNPPIVVVTEPPLHAKGTIRNALYSDGSVKPLPAASTLPAAADPRTP